MQIFFSKEQLLKFSQVATIPVPAIFDSLYPTPPEGDTPIFSRQNDHNGCSLENIDGFDHFLFGFGAEGKKSRGRVW